MYITIWVNLNIFRSVMPTFIWYSNHNLGLLTALLRILCLNVTRVWRMHLTNLMKHLLKLFFITIEIYIFQNWFPSNDIANKDDHKLWNKFTVKWQDFFFLLLSFIWYFTQIELKVYKTILYLVKFRRTHRLNWRTCYNQSNI